MFMLKEVFGILFSLPLGVWFAWLIVQGIRTGQIRHTDSRSAYSLRKQPLGFFCVSLIFLLFAVALLYVATQRALALWQLLFI